MFENGLVANRGEIAVCVTAAHEEFGVRTVAETMETDVVAAGEPVESLPIAKGGSVATGDILVSV
ncbi:hypothetical protein [Natrinema sp. 74]|uniref:hypothetical protein n=1 Tax=Natrinema sp. 74 TaxID=3384159 RepID=UPI0038D3AA2D